jgi:hypothetical protein
VSNGWPNSGGRQRALCILGVHRGGTSAVTRAFNLFGAFVGDAGDLMQPTPENPEGYWERLDIYAFHQRLLAAMQRQWDTVLPLPDGWHHAPAVAPYREELKGIVGKAFAGRPFWAWKDPRSCILLDLWKDLLGELGADLNAVVVLRHPVDVAASLGKRDGFGLEKSCGIWLSHTLAALRSVEGVRTTFIGYDDFLEDPVRQVVRCAEALGIAPPDEAAEAFAAIGDSVCKELRHSLTSADALDAVPAPARRLCMLIRDAMSHPASCDATFFGRIRELHREYSGYSGLLGEDLERLAPTLARLYDMYERCREYDARACSAERRATEAEKRAVIAEEQVRTLARQRTEAARTLEKITNSMTWRTTEPARKLADIIRGKVPFGNPLAK